MVQMYGGTGIPDPTANSMTQQVQLFISCRKIKDLDVFSKSDPQCRIYEFKE
jgi:hypothetical protein